MWSKKVTAWLSPGQILKPDDCVLATCSHEGDISVKEDLWSKQVTAWLWPGQAVKPDDKMRAACRHGGDVSFAGCMCFTGLLAHA